MGGFIQVSGNWALLYIYLITYIAEINLSGVHSLALITCSREEVCCAVNQFESRVLTPGEAVDADQIQRKKQVSKHMALLRSARSSLSVVRPLSPVWGHFVRRLCDQTRSAAPRMTDSSGLGPRRFYEKVSVEVVSPSSDGKKNRRGFGIHLDGKCALTSARHSLIAPSQTLAIAIADEWDAQEERLRASSMPLTRLLAASLDVVEDDMQRFQQGILRYIHTDSFALRADYPQELVSRQEEQFEPVGRHLRDMGIHFRVVKGALDGTQDEDTVKAVEKIVVGLDALQLAAMDSAAGCAKSVAVALALWHGLDAEMAVRAARSEELWQADVWGSVEGGHDIDHADITVRMRAAELVFRCAALDAAKERW
ncbi:ATP12 chaperone protein [Gracilaria domingensis]|nr:ATP12 chaperone protein [Gracilaria domingensis]